VYVTQDRHLVETLYSQGLFLLISGSHRKGVLVFQEFRICLYLIVGIQTQQGHHCNGPAANRHVVLVSCPVFEASAGKHTAGTHLQETVTSYEN